MTKTLLKNTFREIANSKARFISILAIIALGVGFFAGIKATVPSMYNMADEYYSQSNKSAFAKFRFKSIKMQGLSVIIFSRSVVF